MAVRTWAPRGKTPVLRVPLTRDHLIFHQWHHARWAAVPASASGLLRCRSGSGLPARALAQEQGLDHSHLGWLAHPPRTRDQSVSQARSRQTFAPGTTAGVRTRSQPRRGHLELSQTGRVGQCLLCQPGSPLYRAHTSQRALAAEARDYSQLFATMWLLGLVSYREISRTKVSSLAVFQSSSEWYVCNVV